MTGVKAFSATALSAAVLSVLSACVGACSLGFGENFSGGGDQPDQPDGGAAPSTADGSSGGTLADASSDGVTGEDATVTDSDLVALWRLDETSGLVAKDSSLYANDGALKGNPVWSSDGKRNGALKLDGASRFEVPSHPSLAVSNKMTVAFWLRVDVPAPSARVFAYGYGFEVKMNGTHPQLTLDGTAAAANVSQPSGSWHHVAFTFDSGKVTAFYDGFDVGLESNTIATGAVIVQDLYPVVVGASADATYGVAGALDDVRLYRRVLSAAEVSALTK